MPSIKITPKTESDRVDTWLYTLETSGADQADEYIDQLMGGMAHLTIDPSSGIDYSRIRPGNRKIRIAHMMFFTAHLRWKFQWFGYCMKTWMRLADSWTYL